MTRKLFGTDGIRGKANTEPVTAMTALKLAMAAGAEFTRGSHRHRVVIGKDTRLSGYMLQPALTSGFVAMGMDVIQLGPMPTPAIAMLTRSLRADLGVMISASHNPYEDNGIKLFGPDGYKLSDEVEARIEARMAAHETLPMAAPAELGRALQLEDAPGRYTEAVKRSFPKSLKLDGLKIVVDCAHGAAYRVAPTVLWELGAEVVAIGVAPDGFNINRDCGATAPAALQARVIAEKADLGLALDGDADRLILVDEKGRIVDGDQIMALIARSWMERDRLHGGAVVATVMSNLGLERFLAGLKLKLLRTPVGDRYVVERMRAEGCNVGGEQSGHIILSDYGTTGDGLIAALQLLAVIVRGAKPVSETARLFQPLPQLLKNLKFNGGQPLERDEVKAAIKGGEAALGDRGRVLIRKSGTEPVIRIMAEGEDEALVGRVVEDIAQAIQRAAK
ncbi:phosphoglucosamine mutase [Hypericibacter terrae]|uniref:Phosphoglucosamine mutase n=1 Tax=Hypericibacter terrae TaxID=2602015 RepID=A0A5J6MNJ0_9PROT|nr:phosphoglucosamine mutase [Hypericibacter terrae]QEX18801.1 phosphoglucosamine mutase [Hypericibacter terrae]